MLLSHYFASLTERLEKIQSRIGLAQASEKANLYHTVLQLRQISDQVVEEWLGFEEKLVEVQRMFEELEEASVSAVPAQQSDMPGQKEEAKGEIVEEIHLPFALASKFRQGQGYFMLSMYQEAVESFNHVLKEAPDVTVARLYLAFGFLMSRRLDVAYRQFRLLTETCDHAFVCAASYNALGCIAVLEGNSEQGLHWFERSLTSFPELTDARYNQVLTLYHLGRYGEGADAAAPLLDEEAGDVEALLLVSDCRAKNRQEKEAYALLKRAETFADRASQRKAIACAYERLGKFADAVRCYHRLLPDFRNDASVWHGLGWSLWQAEQAEQAVFYLKYALTLAPEQPDYGCSYAWVLLDRGEIEEALQAFDYVRQRYGHPLAYAGMVEALLKQHESEKAQVLINGLLHTEDESVRALGHHLQGKLLFVQGRRDEALRHFSTSHAAGVIRESGLYAGLMHYLDGAHEEAHERWKEFVPEL